MKHITEIARENGYMPFRMKGELVPCESPMEFSTMSTGMLATIWRKEGFPNIVFGLSEYKKPPTLISPKPTVIINGCWRMDDDAINHCLSKEDHQVVFDEITGSNNKIFYYENIHSTQ